MIKIIFPVHFQATRLLSRDGDRNEAFVPFGPDLDATVKFSDSFPGIETIESAETYETKIERPTLLV